ncbi:MAG: sugar phosphate isomerase/epimerase [Bryobacterales bacterium]|nr:sugar phosphate isomerase/epimerase [Bryobacterales bacterium]
MVTFDRRCFLMSGAAAAVALPLAAAGELKRRLGVTTDEIDEDPVVASKFLREFGLGLAEVRNVWGKYNTAQPVDKIKELRKIFDDHKIKCSMLGTGFFKIPLPPDTPEGRAILDNQWSMLGGAFERARVLGVNKIRVFAFTYKDGEKPNLANLPRIHELLTEASRRANQQGIRLAVENVRGSYVSTGAEAAQFLKAVRNDTLGLVWDPNNAGMSGEKAFPDGYKQLDPARIFHVHLRDYRKSANGKTEWCAVGEGEMDNLGQIRALLKAGYKENFTLETHYQSPQGKAHASRTSLTALLKVFAQV